MFGYTYLFGDPVVRGKLAKVTESISFAAYCVDKALAAIGFVTLLVVTVNII